jgi:transposase
VKRLQQSLARKRRTNRNWKNSARYARARAALADIQQRARNRRSDFHHQTAAALTTNHDLIASEALNTRNMTRSAAGTVEQPGVNVRAKSGLNRAILDKGWSQFLNQVLPWHALKRGATVVPVPAHHTSQTCPECGHVDADNRESQAVFACTSCGFSGHADVVAAMNIRERGIELAPAPGHGVAGRGDLAVGRSTKRQPPKRHLALDVA